MKLFYQNKQIFRNNKCKKKKQQLHLLDKLNKLNKKKKKLVAKNYKKMLILTIDP